MHLPSFYLTFKTHLFDSVPVGENNHTTNINPNTRQQTVFAFVLQTQNVAFAVQRVGRGA